MHRQTERHHHETACTDRQTDRRKVMHMSPSCKLHRWAQKSFQRADNPFRYVVRTHLNPFYRRASAIKWPQSVTLGQRSNLVKIVTHPQVIGRTEEGRQKNSSPLQNLKWKSPIAGKLLQSEIKKFKIVADYFRPDEFNVWLRSTYQTQNMFPSFLFTS